MTPNKDDIYDFKNIKPNLNIFKINSDKDVAIKKLLEENFWNDTLNSISSIKNVLISAYEEFSSRLRCFIECLNYYYDLKGKGLIEFQRFINVFKGLTYYQFNFISESNSKSELHVHIHHKVNNPNFVSFAMFKAYLNAIQNIFENLPIFKNSSSNNNYDQYESYKEKLKSFCCKDLTEIESEICEHDKLCKTLITDSKQKFKLFLHKNYAKNCSSFSYNSANYVISDGKQKPTDIIADGRTLFEGYKHVDLFIIKFYRIAIGNNERTIENICKFNDENDKSYQKRLHKIKSIHSIADDFKEYEIDLYADIFGDELQHDKNMHYYSDISNENEHDYLMIENTGDSLSNIFNEDFINRNPITENDNQLSDLLKIQNFSNDLMLNSSKDRNKVSINIYENAFNGDKTMANFANSCDKYLITDVAITTGKEAMHQQNIHELRKASLKYLAIKISEKMNQSITLNIETFDISVYFKSLCKQMSDVFYDVINTGCARVANYNATHRKYLISNKNRMISRLKELADDIQATVSLTLNKIKKEHYNKKDFFIKAMDNVIAEHSRRIKQSKLENNNKSIDSEITYVKEIVNNYCSYYDMKQDIFIASSSPSLLLSSSKSSNNNKINDDNNMSGKKRKNNEVNLFIADEIKEKKTKDSDGKEEKKIEKEKKAALLEKEEEKQKKEMARKAAEEKEEKKKKEMARKASEEKEEKKKKDMARKAAEEKEEKKKKEMAKKAAEEKAEKEKKEKERKDAEEEKERIKFGENEESDEEEQVKIDNKETDKSKQEEKINEKAGEEHEEMDVEVNNDLKIIEVTINELLKTIKSEDGLILVTQFKMLYMNLLHKS
jgi:hypothetical protein